MPTPDDLEKILAAYYAAEYCEPEEQAAKTNHLRELTNAAVHGNPTVSPSILRAALEERYRQYKKARFLKEQRKSGATLTENL
jgi:hypothetical protein